MGTPYGADQLDSEILEAMGELVEGVIGKVEQLGQRFGVPGFCVKALQALASPMAMRDLGKLMHCDPSFVTAIADLLEKRGLARREASTVDRRIKNLVLTERPARPCASRCSKSSSPACPGASSTTRNAPACWH